VQELEEITRISKHVFAIVDSERDSETTLLARNIEAFAKVCDKLGIKCHILKWRAIENYFSDRAVKEVKGNNYRALGHYESLEGVSPHWSKKYDNWRIAREMSLNELRETDLGRFLESL
jgi:hypothetical protein